MPGTVPHALGSLITGITHLREKGGASPQSLIDLQNGYVDQSGSPVSRWGTTWVPSLTGEAHTSTTLQPGTKGACAFKNKIHVFAMSAIAVPDDFVCDILIHPDPTFSGTLDFIHFAKPFLGFLYVVAEFSDGGVYHYWLQVSGTWQANHIYMIGDVVAPSVLNGYNYKATVANNPVAWAPNVARQVGDVVQPTVANGYYYTVVEVDGDNPASGATEPTWLATDGAQVIEDVDNTPGPSSTTNTGSTGSPAGPRYDNPPGGIKGVAE